MRFGVVRGSPTMTLSTPLKRLLVYGLLLWLSWFWLLMFPSFTLEVLLVAAGVVGVGVLLRKTVVGVATAALALLSLGRTLLSPMTRFATIVTVASLDSTLGVHHRLNEVVHFRTESILLLISGGDCGKRCGRCTGIGFDITSWRPLADVGLFRVRRLRDFTNVLVGEAFPGHVGGFRFITPVENRFEVRLEFLLHHAKLHPIVLVVLTSSQQENVKHRQE